MRARPRLWAKMAIFTRTHTRSPPAADPHQQDGHTVHAHHPEATRNDTPRKEACPMWPLPELPCDLPAHLHLLESPDLLYLVCASCGQAAAFSTGGATPAGIAAAARAHTPCPHAGRIPNRPRE
jgi:hypothetical protein